MHYWANWKSKEATIGVRISNTLYHIAGEAQSGEPSTVWLVIRSTESKDEKTSSRENWIICFPTASAGQCPKNIPSRFFGLFSPMFRLLTPKPQKEIDMNAAELQCRRSRSATSAWLECLQLQPASFKWSSNMAFQFDILSSQTTQMWNAS